MNSKLMIVDDHPLYREGVISALSQLMPGTQVLSAPTAQQGLALMPAHPDLELVLIDLDLPQVDGFEALKLFASSHPGVARVMISGQAIDDTMLARAMHLGASGFIPKTLPVHDMVKAIARVLDGDVFMPDLSAQRAPPFAQTLAPDDIAHALSSRQLDVLKLVGQGRSNKEIARELDIAERTVKAHASRVFEVLGASNRTQAVLAAQRLGLLAD